MDAQLLKTTIENAINKAFNQDKDLINQFFGQGKSKDFKGEYDPEQLKMGIKVEMEHTDNPEIAEKIAKDHLAEFSNYYTLLTGMEKKAKRG